MQGYIDLVGLLFVAGVILGALVPERKETRRETIRLFESGETK